MAEFQVTNYATMTVEHLGEGATADDLAEFVALCEQVAERYPEMSEQAVTDAVFGDGDYIRNARRLMSPDALNSTGPIA